MISVAQADGGDTLQGFRRSPALPRKDRASRRSAKSRRQHQHALVVDLASPVVKWAGGKSRILGEILSRFPQSFNRYIEPFVGGASVFFRARPTSAILADSCGELIELYQQLVVDASAVYREMRSAVARSRVLERYYETRQAWNEDRVSWCPARRAGTFIYLNKACFNGLWRVNRSGSFNVPVGKFSSGPSFPKIGSLVAAGDALRKAKLVKSDFLPVVRSAKEGDLLYADPPYIESRKSSDFVSYVSDGFSDDRQAELAHELDACRRRGVHVVVSQSDTEKSRLLYGGDGLMVETVIARRSIAAKSARREDAREIIVTGFSS